MQPEIRIYRRSNPAFVPHKHRDSSYRLHRRHGCGGIRNHREHAQSVFTFQEVAKLVDSGEQVLRMSEGGRGSSPVLIAPDDIAIEYPEPVSM